MSARLRRQWVEMTTEDFQQSDMASAIAILPVAAIEQHGPHLPVEVDTAINRGILARAMELVPPDLPVTVLPAMPIGKSNEHVSYPGTLTLSVETSIMMYLHPDLVRRDKLANFRPRSLDMEGDYEILTPEGSIGFGWETQDLSLPGACGDASDADAERGKLLVEHAAARFVKLLDEIHRYPLSALRAGPLHKK